MTIGVNLRILVATGAATLALAPAVANATPPSLPDGYAVCNTASQNWADGTLTVSPTDPQGFIHFDQDLRAKKNNGVGLYNAAMHSRALAVCGDPAPPADSGDGSNADNGTGDTGPGWGGSGV